MKMKKLVRLVNSFLMPEINERYVNAKLSEIAPLHGLVFGDESLLLRDYEPIKERITPLKESRSTDNRIMYEDIAVINERGSFWEILLWNGFLHSLSKSNSQRLLYDSHRDVSTMFYWEMLKPVTPKEISDNIYRT